ncbi:MAG TPA: DJ-1/PfpI family protein [Chloroflexota bacterium]|nr:DJ-1/PfpI family protein [Chloroflexota bacterium]HUM70589.1 DJ-1/PfpI family protein [Chloroflexota bacterium]
MPTNHSVPNNRIVILLAPGFEETAVVYCMEHMREAGLPVSLVGLSAGILKGLHGLAVRPDYSLDQLSPETVHQGVIMPGGPACVSALLTDPRVHRLLDVTIQNSGFVAVLATAVPLFTQSVSQLTTAAPHFIRQGEMGITEFTDYLIDFALA